MCIQCWSRFYTQTRNATQDFITLLLSILIQINFNVKLEVLLPVRKYSTVFHYGLHYLCNWEDKKAK